MLFEFAFEAVLPPAGTRQASPSLPGSGVMSPPSGDQGDRDFCLAPDDGSETDLEIASTDNEQKNPEAASFLDIRSKLSDDCDRTAHDSQPASNRKSKARRFLSFLSGGAFPWLVNFILALALLIDHHNHNTTTEKTCASKDAPPVLTPTIAKAYIEYRAEVMYDGADKRNPTSPYQGWPTAEKDALWDRFNGAMFRISSQEALTLPHRTLQVAVPEPLPRKQYISLG